ncbi:MAG: hypothetical protein EA357_10555 [Micavibrio sp.]|nr:MAG: hypothetical protein EA357_10555 [Micavibrio sp.]
MTDYRKIAAFCLGALGWPPQIFWHEAGLQDIADALEGYAQYRCGMRPPAPPPRAAFLAEMLEKFPDHAEA